MVNLWYCYSGLYVIHHLVESKIDVTHVYLMNIAVRKVDLFLSSTQIIQCVRQSLNNINLTKLFISSLVQESSWYKISFFTLVACLFLWICVLNFCNLMCRLVAKNFKAGQIRFLQKHIAISGCFLNTRIRVFGPITMP